MNEKITKFKEHVIEESSKPSFLHHKWFVKWHLQIVQQIATELCEYYPDADRDLVELLVWLHDYGKILDFDDEYGKTLTAGRQKLNEIGFDAEFVNRAISYIEILDKKLEIDLREAPIEVQIVSSADGCSHIAGPFLLIFWHEATDKTFVGKTYEELMVLNRKKIEKDWQYKIVLPEARQAFEGRHNYALEQAGFLPTKFFA